jgi:hypothetical protein
MEHGVTVEQPENTKPLDSSFVNQVLNVPEARHVETNVASENACVNDGPDHKRPKLDPTVTPSEIGEQEVSQCDKLQFQQETWATLRFNLLSKRVGTSFINKIDGFVDDRELVDEDVLQEAIDFNEREDKREFNFQTILDLEDIYRTDRLTSEGKVICDEICLPVSGPAARKMMHSLDKCKPEVRQR